LVNSVKTQKIPVFFTESTPAFCMMLMRRKDGIILIQVDCNYKSGIE
jgi:hypothetical protein